MSASPYVLKHTNFVLRVDTGTYSFNPGDLPVFGTLGTGMLSARPFDSIPNYSLLMRVGSF
ncbi:MAG: hypothetical protein J4F31_00885 [Flavobacteriales bacterium]|nr:hypothetical protein [Flavobacteriales bacterium]